MTNKNTKPILLKDIFRITNPEDYKAHFATKNDQEEPLDAWVRDKAEWQKWQSYRPKKNDFNRDFIFSLMKFYHEENVWLFGGIFEVLERGKKKYKVKLKSEGKEFIGRLKIRPADNKRKTRVYLESQYDNFEVVEILAEPYTGEVFSGYNKIDLSFSELEGLIKNNRKDWSSPLRSVSGIYLITDIKAGKRYVGSAYGAGGVWKRWNDYIKTSHGGNKDLRGLLKTKKKNYSREYFRFSLLEHHPSKIDKNSLIERENFWKEVLLTRGSFGYNKN